MGKEGESAPFLTYADPEPFGIGYFGVCTGWGATGEWLIEGKCQNSISPLAIEGYTFTFFQKFSFVDFGSSSLVNNSPPLLYRYNVIKIEVIKRTRLVIKLSDRSISDLYFLYFCR